MSPRRSSLVACLKPLAFESSPRQQSQSLDPSSLHQFLSISTSITHNQQWLSQFNMNTWRLLSSTINWAAELISNQHRFASKLPASQPKVAINHWLKLLWIWSNSSWAPILRAKSLPLTCECQTLIIWGFSISCLPIKSSFQTANKILSPHERADTFLSF